MLAYSIGARSRRSFLRSSKGRVICSCRPSTAPAPARCRDREAAPGRAARRSSPWHVRRRPARPTWQGRAGLPSKSAAPEHETARCPHLGNASSLVASLSPGSSGNSIQWVGWTSRGPSFSPVIWRFLSSRGPGSTASAATEHVQLCRLSRQYVARLPGNFLRKVAKKRTINRKRAARRVR